MLESLKTVIGADGEKKYTDKAQVLEQVSLMLESSSAISTSQWFFLLSATSLLAGTLGVDRSVLDALRELENRTLSIPLISQFKKAFVWSEYP